MRTRSQRFFTLIMMLAFLEVLSLLRVLPAQAAMAASTKDIWPSVCIFAERDATATYASAVHRTGLHPADVTWAPASMQGAWDQTTRKAEYEGQGYKVTFILDQWWGTAYNGRVRVQNTGGAPIDDWCLRLPLASEITNIWNADIQSHEDGTYLIKNKGWNQDVSVGGSVEFGFEAAGTFPGFPETCELVGERVVVDAAAYEASYTVRSDWGTGFDGIITIKNISDKTIEDWTLTLELNNEVSNLWGAEVRGHEGTCYELACPAYAQNIAPGQSVEIGFTVQAGTSANKASVTGMTRVDTTDATSPGNRPLPQIDRSVFPKIPSAGGGKERYVVGTLRALGGTLKNEGVATSLRYEVVRDGKVLSSGSVDVAESWKIEGLKLGYGENRLTVTATDSRGREYSDSIDVYNISSANMGDLIEDVDELVYMFTHDSDADGLADFIEMEATFTSPLKTDSDEDGIPDGDEDADNDGLTNAQELPLGTDPSLPDSDEDGLGDAAEVNGYHTDPLKEDTDADGARDKWELDHDFDPRVYDKTFTTTMTKEVGERIESVSVTFTGDGRASENLSISPIDYAPFGSDIPGYLGSGHEFLTDGEFGSAVVSYTLDEALLADPKVKPVLYRLNEETQLLEEVDGQTLDGNILTASLAHFSQYVVLNKVEHEDGSWGYGLFYYGDYDPAYEKIDVVFAIDSSGSMEDNDATGARKDATNSFIDRLAEGDRAAVVDFDHSARVYENLTTNKQALHDAVGKIDSSGGTNLSAAMSTAIGLITDSSYEGDGRGKFIVLLTDGDGSYDDAWTKTASDNRITVFTVGLGASVSEDVLKRIAGGTRGAYYHVNDAAKLLAVFDAIANEADLRKDTDGDGLSDYYEKQMARGSLRLGTNVPLWGMDYLNKDTDGDGLRDGEELFINFGKPSQSDSEPNRYIYAILHSNPTKEDSDDDGMHDGHERIVNDTIAVAPKDPSPLHADVTDHPGIWDEQYAEAVAGKFATGLQEEDLIKIPLDTYPPIFWPAFSIPTNFTMLGMIMSQRFGIPAGMKSVFLNFRLDEQNAALHARVETWQKIFGYNDIYDVGLFLGTAGRTGRKKFPFTVNGRQYIVWTWHGNYLDLGDGAEIGLYVDPSYLPTTIIGSLIPGLPGWLIRRVEHWSAVDFEVPMSLSLYDCAATYKSIFHWAPTTPQWWVTGFNPDVPDVGVDDMLSVGSINFSNVKENQEDREAMYWALKKETQEDTDKDKLMIFDDSTKKAWLVWRGWGL